MRISQAKAIANVYKAIAVVQYIFPQSFAENQHYASTIFPDYFDLEATLVAQNTDSPATAYKSSIAGGQGWRSPTRPSRGSPCACPYVITARSVRVFRPPQA